MNTYFDIKGYPHEKYYCPIKSSQDKVSPEKPRNVELESKITAIVPIKVKKRSLSEMSVDGASADSAPLAIDQPKTKERKIYAWTSEPKPKLSEQNIEYKLKLIELVSEHGTRDWNLIARNLQASFPESKLLRDLQCKSLFYKFKKSNKELIKKHLTEHPAKKLRHEWSEDELIALGFLASTYAGDEVAPCMKRLFPEHEFTKKSCSSKFSRLKATNLEGQSILEFLKTERGSKIKEQIKKDLNIES